MNGVKPLVTRLRAGKTEKIEVTLGTRDDATERVELLTGITAGDTLLLGAAQGITAGTPLRVSTGSDKAAAQAAPTAAPAKSAPSKP